MSRSRSTASGSNAAHPTSTPEPRKSRRQRPSRGPLAGTERRSAAELEGIRVVRWEVCPKGAQHPASFAIDPESPVPWTQLTQCEVPLLVTWSREAESRWALAFPLTPGVRCLGLGERYGGLDRRGRVHTLLATDDPHHVEATDRLYKSIPLLLLVGASDTIGLFLDSPAPQRWDLDRDLEGSARIELLSRRGWQLYLFGPGPLPAVVAAYTRLTGRSGLPPLWSLGHQQSRWSYATERQVRETAAEFRARGIPCDTLVLDIDYMDRYRVFTVSRRRFPEFDHMIRDLAEDGFHVVPIVDPGVAADARDPTYRDGSNRGLFCSTPKGTAFVDKVWPGPACFPDFLRAEVRDWWGQKLQGLLARGVAGIWNDMNEPSFFERRNVLDAEAKELPRRTQESLLQEAPEGLVGHLEVRNVYGQQMARAAAEALYRARPDERPFVLTRSGYAGTQRHSAVWLGDNNSWFEHLRLSIPMLVNVGLSGLPFCGVDVGGFGGDADGELLVRWYQVGIFYPFFRNHCAHGQRPQEPWAFGAAVEGWIRRLIEVRYRLLPYFERLFVEHREDGAPLLRPLSWHYPEDPIGGEVDDQFLCGSEILVAPIVQRARRGRAVYLPAGVWYPFDGGPPLRGGRHHWVEWAFDSVPAFVRDGAILPLADPVQHTGELAGSPVTFRCFGRRCRGRYWQDDGRTLGYQRGEFNDWELRLNRGTLTARPRHLGLVAPQRRYYVQLGMGRRVRWQLEVPQK